MNLEYSSCEVYSNIQVSTNIYEMKLRGDFNGEPGQFYMLRSWDIEPFLSRPISISNLDENYLTFLYEVKGKGTKLFSNLKKGDLLKLTGPIGTSKEAANAAASNLPCNPIHQFLTSYARAASAAK